MRTRKKLRDTERTVSSTCYDQLFFGSKVTASNFRSSTIQAFFKSVREKSSVRRKGKILHLDRP